MNKIEIYKKLQKLNLDKNEYCVFSGAVMVIYGLRDDTPDIDLYVSEKLFKELNKKYDLKPLENIPGYFKLDNNTDITIVNLKDYKIVDIDGYPTLSLEDILAFKKSLNREKDQKDVELITSYLENCKK